MRKMTIFKGLTIVLFFSGILSCKKYVCECHYPSGMGITTTSSDKQKATEDCNNAKIFAEEQGGTCAFYTE
jgi:hypothetical protein